jgi:hypothetical protein
MRDAVRMMQFTDAEFSAALPDADSTLFSGELGGEVTGGIEAIHQLHCLVRQTSHQRHTTILTGTRNFLRKSSIWYHEYYKTRSPEFRDSEATTHMHFGTCTSAIPSLSSPNAHSSSIDHCVEMLRQNLMCNADTGLITYRWVEGHNAPYPNFNTPHKCKNFDALLKIAYKRQVPEGGTKNLLKPQAGEKIWKIPP